MRINEECIISDKNSNNNNNSLLQAIAMPYTAELFQQDLKAIGNSLEREDFQNLNIFANRIMSNSYIFKDRSRMICGFILKDLAMTLIPLGQRKKTKSAISTAKALTAGFYKKVFDASKSEIATEKIWSQYHEYSNASKRYLMDEDEDAAYTKEDPKFTHDAVKILLAGLKQNKHLLSNPRCQILKGTLNEISRLYKVHGGNLSDEFAFALITALDRCHDYIIEVYSPDVERFANEIDSKVLPELDKILEIMQKVEDNKGEWIVDVDDELFKLSSMWREFFVLYLEPGRNEREANIRLPDESRKKLTEVIARTLEEELPKKNK